MPKSTKKLIPEKRILKIILIIRGEKVILDSDLAALYGVETRRLNEQVRRNIDKFPEDFYVPIDQRGVCQLEIANCDIKFGLGRSAENTLGFY